MYELLLFPNSLPKNLGAAYTRANTAFIANQTMPTRPIQLQICSTCNFLTSTLN
jgi:hypothetical protein